MSYRLLEPVPALSCGDAASGNLKREGVPVTPRGGGTGKAGGCIPVEGGIVLSLERMNRIKEIDAGNRFAVVEPGVVLWTLHEECGKHGLFYPVDMSSGGSCELGGNVACDAGGERAVKYGTTRAQGTGVGAVSCAFAMQQAIKEFPELALKVCIASGDARRFVVGDESIQRTDALAGAIVARTATGGHLTHRGEVLIDEVTANALGSAIAVKEWRSDEVGSERFAVVEQDSGDRDRGSVNTEPKPPTPDPQTLKSWIHQKSARASPRVS